MAKRRKSIPLLPHEDALLRQLYTVWRIPIDQYERRPQMLDLFVRTWNEHARRDDSPGDVIHFMRTKRKNRKWVTFDGKHERCSLVDYRFTAEEIAVATEVYEALMLSAGLGSDNFAYDEALAAKLSMEFARRTGRVVPGLILSSVLMQIRKRGNLPKRDRDHRSDEDTGFGFGDIDEVAG